MARTTKESLRKARMGADQDRREALCRTKGHVWRNEYNHMRYCETCYALEKYNWIKPGMTVVHLHDPAWVGEVLAVTNGGVRVRRSLPSGSIEETFQSDELRIVIPSVPLNEEHIA